MPPEAPLVDVLLDQRIASGIGNVYKSELLFLAGWSPQRRLGETSDEELAGLYAEAARLLAINARGGSRATREGGGLWVYKRAGRPCRRCSSSIRYERAGRDRRGTYSCPVCQPPAS